VDIHEIAKRIENLEPGQKVEINSSLLITATTQQLRDLEFLCKEKGAEIERHPTRDTLTVWVK
jgi:hypothetical protein